MNCDHDSVQAAAAAYEGRLNRLVLPGRPPLLRAIPNATFASEMLARVKEGSFSDGEEAILLGCEIEEALRAAVDVHVNRLSRQRCFDLFSNLCDLQETIDAVRRGGVVVELGCGSINPYGLLFVFLMAGASRAIAIDLDGIQNTQRATKVLADLAGLMLVNPACLVGDFPISRNEVLQNIGSFDLARLYEGDSGGIDEQRLPYRQDSVHALSLGDAEADVIVSTAFLEHIGSLDAAFAEMARVTKPGGIGVHIIDGSDHRRYTDLKCHPLEFLTEESDNEFIYGSNRVRPQLFAPLVERHGFEVVSVVPFEYADVPEDLKRRFVEPFRSMPEEVLRVIGAKLVTRRLHE